MFRKQTHVPWKTAALIGCWIVINIIDGTSACRDALPLHEMHRRSRSDTSSSEAVTDFYLSPGWYTVTVNGNQYHMPGAGHKPDLGACGTFEPIYLNDNSTDFDTVPGDGTELIVKTCTLSPFSTCDWADP